MELCLTGRRTGRSGKSLLRLTLPAPAAPPKEVPQRFLADRLKSLIEAWSRVVTSLEANLEATPLAAPSLPYMKRSPQVSHEASNDRTWPRESRRQRAVCPVTDQGARFEGHYVPGGILQHLGLKLAKSQCVPFPLRLPPMVCGLGNFAAPRSIEVTLAECWLLATVPATAGSRARRARMTMRVRSQCCWS